MNHVVVRTITALATASLVVVGLLYLPVNVISVVLIVLVALAHLEFSQMVAKKYETMTWVGVALGVCTMLSPHIPIKSTVEAGFSFELLLRQPLQIWKLQNVNGSLTTVSSLTKIIIFNESSERASRRLKKMNYF